MNHFDPCLSINSLNKSPNLYEKYDTKKNLNPLEIKLIKTKTKKLNPNRPLAIVKTLKGRGVKPAKKSIPSQA